MATQTHENWTTVQKILFRFFCCFLVISIFPFPLDSIPFITDNVFLSLGGKVSSWYAAIWESYNNMWHKIIPWIAMHVYGIRNPITVIYPNGSGDTSYDYFFLLTTFLIALIGTIVWTVMDRKRESYVQALYWLRTLVRFYLFVAMLGYGFQKIFHLQMPSPSLSQLLQPFGTKSPAALAWSFIGYSKVFSAFTGWGEVIGGLLLMSRRTTTLGSLLLAVVMSNVAAINYCYDVPVKLYSSSLLLMVLFLLSPDAKKLWSLFVLNQPAQLHEYNFEFSKKWVRITATIVKWVFVVYIISSDVSGLIKMQKEFGDDKPRAILYGIYNTRVMIRNHDTIPPLATDTTRWKQIVVENENYAQIRLMNDSAKFYNFRVDTINHSVTIFSRRDTTNKSSLSYQMDSLHLKLWGKYKADSVYILMERYDPNRFLLINRGFHWINEYPFFR